MQASQLERKRAKFSDALLGLIMGVSALISNQTTSFIDAVLTQVQINPKESFGTRCDFQLGATFEKRKIDSWLRN